MAKKPLAEPDFTKFPELTNDELIAMDEDTFTSRLIDMQAEARSRRADGTQLLYEASQLDQTIAAVLQRRLIVVRQLTRQQRAESPDTLAISELVSKAQEEGTVRTRRLHTDDEKIDTTTMRPLFTDGPSVHEPTTRPLSIEELPYKLNGQ